MLNVKYETVIGLEVHAQLKTKTKIFCSCSTEFGRRANENTCPICLGMPGVLPVLNKQAVEFAMRACLATHCQINPCNQFDRKNFFYPDMPKGYQISQFAHPIGENGHVNIEINGEKKRVRIMRIHMEEDAGKLIHGENLGIPGKSYVDFNRTGTPLIEIVTQPDLRSPEEAREYLTQLKAILEYTAVSDCNMEEGSLRCDANISLRPAGQKKLGTRTELKNLNSFRFVQKAIEYEVDRQSRILDQGDSVIQETRLYDSDKGVTLSMRSKEEAHDYRYFPEPDLPPLRISQEEVDGIRAGMPELPGQLRERFESEFGLSSYDADVLSQTLDLAGWYESLVAAHPSDPKRCANWMANELLGRLKEQGKDIADSPVSAQDLAGLLDRIADNTISGKIAKDVLDAMMATGESADAVIESKGLKQVSDSGAIDTLILQIMADNPGQLEQFRAGKDKLFGFFVGQVMKASKGQANPGMVNQRLQDLLKG